MTEATVQEQGHGFLQLNDRKLSVIFIEGLCPPKEKSVQEANTNLTLIILSNTFLRNFIFFPFFYVHLFLLRFYLNAIFIPDKYENVSMYVEDDG
jgi:hypothetical protein